MTPAELQDVFRSRYGEEAVTVVAPEAFKVEFHSLILYGILSRDHLWVRLLAPVASADEARPFLEQLMAANFEDTETVRYALQDEMLWLVFQHQLERLQRLDLEEAVMMLTDLRKEGLEILASNRMEMQLQQIIQANKSRGQSLESTLQTLQHFYQEGLMGGLDQPADEREATLDAWRFQLTRLWDTVEPGDAVLGDRGAQGEESPSEPD